MKAFNKYFSSPVIFLAVFIVGTVISSLPTYFITIIYDYLTLTFPELFKSYNPITTPEEYKTFSLITSSLSIAIALAVLHYTALRLDNRRLEFLMKETEGFYTMKEGLTLYFKEMWLSDIISAAFPPVAIAIPLYFIPDKILRLGWGQLFWSCYPIASHTSPTEALILSLILSLLTRLIVTPKVVEVWRANWLSEVDV